MSHLFLYFVWVFFVFFIICSYLQTSLHIITHCFSLSNKTFIALKLNHTTFCYVEKYWNNVYLKWSCPFILFSAISDYETAAKHSENDRQINEGLERAQRLLKQSKRRDYYKILGVKRWAPMAGVLYVYMLQTGICFIFSSVFTNVFNNHCSTSHMMFRSKS